MNALFPIQRHYHLTIYTSIYTLYQYIQKTVYKREDDIGGQKRRRQRTTEYYRELFTNDYRHNNKEVTMT